MKRSLQRQLSLMSGAAILMIGLIAAVASFYMVYSEAEEFQDDLLRQVAVLAAVGTINQPLTGVFYPRRNGPGITDFESRLVVIRMPDAEHPPWLPRHLTNGFHPLNIQGEPFRTFVYESKNGIRTVVAQPRAAIEDLALDSALHSLIPLLILMPVLVWSLRRIVRRELAPVSQLSAILDQLPADRPRSLPDNEVPAEIIPFIQAINRLFERINELMIQQRRFIADAAHELRSPLTALSIQAQNLRQVRSLSALGERLIPLQAGIERARLLIEQLLALARTQASTSELSLVALSPLVRELIAEFLPQAEAKGIDLGLEETATLTLRATPDALRLIIKNALENALKYTPQRGEVTVHISQDYEEALIEVVDSGPGIPPLERERAFDPFYRLPGSTEEGCGLGLTIAREAAEHLGGRLSLHGQLHGSGLVFSYRQRLINSGVTRIVSLVSN